MVRSNWSEANKEKVIRRKWRKTQDEPSARVPTLSEKMSADKKLLQRTFGNQAVESVLGQQPEKNASEKAIDSPAQEGVDQILARSAHITPASVQRMKEPRRIDVRPAITAERLGQGAKHAAAEPLIDPQVASQLDAETIRTMSPNFVSAEAKAARWNKMADVVGAGAPLIATLITVATGGTGAPAAQIVNVAAKGLTILFKELEKQGLMGEIEALERMLPYVSPDDPGQYVAWKQRINEYVGKIGRADVKEIKALLSLFEPPMVVGAAEFVGSLLYKKKIEAQTAEAAKKVSHDRILQWLKDRDMQQRQQKGEFASLDEMGDQEDRVMAVSPGHTKLGTVAKLKNAFKKKRIQPI